MQDDMIPVRARGNGGVAVVCGCGFKVRKRGRHIANNRELEERHRLQLVKPERASRIDVRGAYMHACASLWSGGIECEQVGEWFRGKVVLGVIKASW